MVNMSKLVVAYYNVIQLLYNSYSVRYVGIVCVRAGATELLITTAARLHNTQLICVFDALV